MGRKAGTHPPGRLKEGVGDPAGDKVGLDWLPGRVQVRAQVQTILQVTGN